MSEEVYAFPASAQQRQLWFLYQMDPTIAAYNIPFAYRIKGALDIPNLQNSITQLFEKHETFRTTLAVNDGELMQLVAPAWTTPIAVQDLAGQAEANDDALLRERLDQFARLPFNVSEGPLARAEIWNLGAEDNILLLNFHHIILDHTSILNFANELGSVYAASAAGSGSGDGEPPLQYADVVMWQLDETQTTVLDEKLAYWKQNLAGSEGALDLPTDRQRPAYQTLQGTEKNVQFSPGLSKRLREFSRAERKSLFMTTLAALKAVLHRYTGADDVIIGCPFANRNQPGMEDVMGCIMNTLPIRTQIAADTTFRSLIDQVREATLGAQAHQEVSFEQIVEAVQPHRDPGYNPLFQVSFMFQDAPMELNIPNCTTSNYGLHNGCSKFDITLWMWDDQTQLRGLLEYNTDLFDSETMDRFMGHFEALLSAMIGEADKPVVSLPYLTAAELEQITRAWNDTGEEYGRESNIAVEFEAAAKRHQEKTAVIEAGGHTASFGELDAASNRLANYLIGQGLQTGDCVAICMNRTMDMVTGLLGILKAGGTYIPLDPMFPADRIAFMLEDSAAPFVLTESSLLDAVPDSSAHVIVLDNEADAVSNSAADKPAVEISADSLAYIIYTSGSTGKPKGVQLRHRNVLNFLHAMADKPGFSADNTLLAVTTISFDISVLELFLPLTRGGTVVVADKEMAADGHQLVTALNQHNVDIMQATPTTWRLMLEADWSGSDRLKILCGGEAFPPDLAADLLPRCESLWNMYGPTETTVWSTVKQLTLQDANVTIGHPIANTTVYVLDQNLQPVPTGIAGELHIGGDGVAAGYLNRPELTSERFIDAPASLAAEKNGKLYKTGDLVRWLPGGELEFISRVDFQVKIRGFRIELGEIEATIADNPAVDQVVVLAREDRPGDKRLVAYLQTNFETSLRIGKLKKALRANLPDYMIPQAFVPMESFPLTPNGKIDRKALPQPDMGAAGRDTIVPPSSDIELKIAAIWKQLLGLEQVGLNHNFFDIGGHSLLSMKMISQIDQQIGLRISPRDVLVQNLGQIAALCEEQVSAAQHA